MKSFSIVDSKGHIRPMLRLALPSLAEEMLVLAVTWTDWWLAGRYFQHYGDATKAAMGTMAYVMWLIPCLFATVAIGATAIIARRVGKGEIERASLGANQAFLIGTGLAIVLTAALVCFGSEFLSLMQLKGEAHRFAVEYLEVVAVTIPLLAVSQISAACLKGAGDMVSGFLVKGVVVLVNIVVSTMLVTGWGPVEAVGWKGIAMGTACGYTVGGLLLACVMLKGRAGLRLTAGQLSPNRAEIRELVRIGLPGGFEMGALIGCQLLFLAIVNSLGKNSAAAHGLAVQIEACAWLPGAAFQAAAATMAGQFLGAGMPERSTRGTLSCLLVGMTIMCVSGAAFWLCGDSVASFFTGTRDDATTRLTARLLRLVSFAMPALAIVMILGGGAFRGAGDTLWLFLLTMFGFVLVRVPLAAVLSLEDLGFIGLADVKLLGWGVIGAWYAMVADLWIRSVLLVWRFANGKWRIVQID